MKFIDRVLCLAWAAALVMGTLFLAGYLGDTRKRLDALEARVAQSEAHWRDFIDDIHRLTRTNDASLDVPTGLYSPRPGVTNLLAGGVAYRVEGTNVVRIGVPGHSETNAEAPALKP